MKKIVIIVCFILVAAGVGFYFTYNLLHDPMYAIKQVSLAITNHDWPACQKYLDIDAMYEAVGKRKDYSTFQEGLAQVLKDNLKENFSNALKASVESVDDSNGPLKSLQHADSIVVKTQIVPMGKIVAVRLWEEYGQFKTPAYTEVVLRSQGLGYVIIDINGENRYERSLAVERLYKEFYMYPIERQLQTSAKITLTKKIEGCSNWIYDTCIQPLTMFERKIENLTEKNIKEISFRMNLGEYTKYVTDKNIKAKSIVMTGRNRGWEYNQFINEDRAWKFAELESIFIDIQSIMFDDGTVLERDPLAYYSHLDDLAPFDEVIFWGKQHFYYEADSLKKWSEEFQSVN